MKGSAPAPSSATMTGTRGSVGSGPGEVRLVQHETPPEQSLNIFQPTERCIVPGVVTMIPMCGTIKGLAPLGPSLSPLPPRQRARRIQQDCCDKAN